MPDDMRFYRRTGAKQLREARHFHEVEPVGLNPTLATKCD